MTSPEWEAANEDDSDRFPQTLQESASESTESHERGSRVVPDPARVARYAEAMHASTCDVTRKPPCPVDGYLAWRRWAEAAMAVADEERASLVAEVERLSSNLSDLLCELTGGRLSKTNYDVRTMVREVEAYFEEFAEEDRAAAVAAEAKVAKVEALADRWGAESSKTAVGIIKHGCAAELRAVLADAPAEQPWVCRHRPRCADAACSHNPAIQRWIAGEQRAEGGA